MPTPPSTANAYPGADLSRYYGDKFNGAIMPKWEKLLLHSTETKPAWGAPGYREGRDAPTLTVDPWPHSPTFRKVWQHFELNRASRALVNPSSTAVGENTDGVIQIEILGYSDPKNGATYGAYLPDLPTAGVQFLASVIVTILRMTGISASWPARPWPLYPASYGNSPARMTGPEYDAYRGILGHLHASGNDHGDPSLPLAALKAEVSRLLTTPPTKTGTDMKLTDPLPGLLDADGSPVTIAEALARGNWAYSQVVSSGWVSKAVAALKANDASDDQKIARALAELDAMRAELTNLKGKGTA